MKYMVTGGAGFIGSHLCDRLCENKDNQVVCIDNLVGSDGSNIKHLLKEDNFEFVEKDISAYSFWDIMRYFYDIDVVFHLAASKCSVCRTLPYIDLLTNGRGSWNVFECARRIGAKVIHASTGSVSSGNPKSFYGSTKLLAESYLNAFKCYYPDFNYTILRYYHVYGTRQNTKGVIPKFITRILDSKSIVIEGSGEQQRRFTNVNDIVNANILAANNNLDVNNFNVISDFPVTIKELAYLLYDVMGKKPYIQYTDGRPDETMSFDNISNNDIKSLGMRFNNNFLNNLEGVIGWYKNERNREDRTN